ncbi:hypothetical protein B9Z19DRAFT_779621 [Tuber borchii]|uniref:Uncharacterized protein n=1 Tax=Tuber borchii TaxID=42251 RepID=A0A2T6ZWL0_TUBBO|nr:hypothetical protein B9Z19DRAFT_779621 [Tuber borchii]
MTKNLKIERENQGHCSSMISVSGAKGLSGGGVEIDSQKAWWGELPKRDGNLVVARAGGEGGMSGEIKDA